MIADFLRKGLAWARAFFWVSESDTSESTRAGDSRGPGKPAGGQGASAPGGKTTGKSASKSTGKSTTAPGPKSTVSGTTQRRPAAAKTSTHKRGTTAAKRSGQGGSATAKSPATRGAGNKSTGPGQPAADPAKPGDLTEIKGIGPKMKTQLAEMGIKSFADLAGADAKQIASKLDSRTITAERVRGWIAEAKKRS